MYAIMLVNMRITLNLTWYVIPADTNYNYWSNAKLKGMNIGGVAAVIVISRKVVFV